MWLLAVATMLSAILGDARCEFTSDMTSTIASTVVQALRPSGLRIAVPDSPGVNLIVINANINFPLDMKDRGQISQSIVEPKSGLWTVEDLNITVKPGDVVFFWIYMSKNDKNQRKEGRRVIKDLVDHDCDPTPTTYNGRSACRGQLLFQDNFDTFNPDVWKHTIQLSGDPDREFTIYDSKPQNAFVKDGKLHIAPSVLEADDISKPLKLEECTWKRSGPEYCERKPFSWDILPPVRSAWLNTADSFTFRYGRVEVYARAAKGDWMLSRVFLEPRDNAYGIYPFDSGRLSLLRVLGNADLRESSYSQLPMGASRTRSQASMATCYRVYHMYEDTRLPPGERTYSDETPYGQDVVYSIVWRPDSITFGVEGRDVLTVRPPAGGFSSLDFFRDACDNSPWKNGDFMAPFDKEFSINVAVQVGGIHNFQDNSTSGGYTKPWKDNGLKMVLDFWKARDKWLPTWQHGFEIDSISVWAI